MKLHWEMEAGSRQVESGNWNAEWHFYIILQVPKQHFVIMINIMASIAMWLFVSFMYILGRGSTHDIDEFIGG